MTEGVPKVGDILPGCWWDTGDGRPAGQHEARIMAVLPYRGPLPFVRCILRLHAPLLKRGYLEMSYTG